MAVVSPWYKLVLNDKRTQTLLLLFRRIVEAWCQKAPEPKQIGSRQVLMAHMEWATRVLQG